MDGLDISAIDQLSEHMFTRLDDRIIDDDNETYQSALSDCLEPALNSTSSDPEEDPELEHKPKKLKTVDDEERNTLEVTTVSTEKLTSDGSSLVLGSECKSDEVEQQFKLAGETLVSQAVEFQESHKSDNSKDGFKSGSQASVESPKADESMRSSQSPQVVNNRSENKTGECKSTPTLYQRFIQSNSVSLSKSPKFEALQCPYCVHGFVNFSALETHVVFCKKKKKNDDTVQ